MVTHLPIAGGDAVSVKSAFRCDGVVARRLLAAAAAAGGVTVRPSGTGSAVLARAVLARAVRLRRGVRVL